jgi:hypothetical protein
LSRIKIFINPRRVGKNPISTGITLIEIPNTNKVTVQHRAKPHTSLAEHPQASQSKSIAAAVFWNVNLKYYLLQE